MSYWFEWDAAKAEANLTKHGVSFEEAETVFADPLGWIYPDPLHSRSEFREILIGSSALGRLLLVCFAERGSAIRIINCANRPSMSARNTKKIAEGSDEMPTEYPLDHSQATPNRFAARMPRGRVVGVVLEPDVAAVFPTSDAVNRYLRSVIEAMPQRQAATATLED